MTTRARATLGRLAAGLLAVAALAPRALAKDETAAANGEAPRAVVYGTFEDEEGGRQAFDLLKQAEKDKVIAIESYAIVTKDEKGNVHIKDQRRKGAGAGAIVGAVVGLLGGPVGVAIGAGAGGAVGYLTGDAVGMPKEAVEELESSLEPGQSAVIAVVEERWVERVAEDMQRAQARRTMRQPIKPAAPPPKPAHKGYPAERGRAP